MDCHRALRPGHRCEAGRATVDPACTAHPEHFWCVACRGWYGVPHDLYSCHTKQAVSLDARPSGATGPAPGQCACRFCVTVHTEGWQQAWARFQPGRPRPVRGPKSVRGGISTSDIARSPKFARTREAIGLSDASRIGLALRRCDPDVPDVGSGGLHRWPLPVLRRLVARRLMIAQFGRAVEIPDVALDRAVWSRTTLVLDVNAARVFIGPLPAGLYDELHPEEAPCSS